MAPTQPQTSLESLIEPLLRQLDREAELLHVAIERSREVYEALRAGDLPRMMSTLPQQKALAEELQIQAENRTRLAVLIAELVSLKSEELTLCKLAAHLPEKFQHELSARRDSLSLLSAELISFQQSNANLIHHLRTYFQGVLSGLTTEAVPTRYGPSGARVGVSTGMMVLARG